MNELDKAIEVLKETMQEYKNAYETEDEMTNGIYEVSNANFEALNLVVSTIEQLRDKVNKDIEDCNTAIKLCKINNEYHHNLDFKLEEFKKYKEIIGG